MAQRELNVFISYCRKDKDRVLPLVKDVEAKSNARCWIDLQGIESGAQFEEVIINAINQSEVVLLMVSGNLLDSFYVKKEIEYALLKNKRVVPLFFDRSDCPEWVRFKFSGYDFIDLNDKDQYNKLVRNLKAWSGDSSCDVQQESLYTPRHHTLFLNYFLSSRRRLYWAVGAVVLTLLILFGVIKVCRSSDPAPQSSPQSTVTIDGHQGLYTNNLGGVSFSLVKVEGGSFRMGDPNQANNPLVTLNTFYIGETEVTQALWKAVMGNNPSDFKGDNCPVEQVSYEECLEFVEKLNKLKKTKFRLPTEAEWEFAARGGNLSHGYRYSGGDNLNVVAWYWQNSGDSILEGDSNDPDEGWNPDAILGNNSRTHEVKTKQPNELGIYDMSGNVEEWCADLFDKNQDGVYVYRGGSWCCKALECEVSARYSFSGELKHRSLGFRLAMDM